MRATTNLYSKETRKKCILFVIPLKYYVIVINHLFLFIIRGDDATEFWVLGCLCDGAIVKKYKPVNEFMKSADFDVASEVQGICDPRCY